MVLNARGVPIDINHAHAYLDAHGSNVLFGGTPEERLQLARELVSRDHSLSVVFESRPKGFIRQAEVTRVSWFDAAAHPETRDLPPGPFVEKSSTVPALRSTLPPDPDELAGLYPPVRR